MTIVQRRNSVFSPGLGAISFSRASAATRVNASGNLETVGVDVPRIDHDPVTRVVRGLLVEEQRTNSIRNNTMVGAVAGTPGTLPTNWAIGGSGLGTLNSQVVGVGSSGGINYIDLRFWGTNSTTDFGVRFEPSGQVAATQNQTWTNSFWLAMVGGSTANIQFISSNIAEATSGGTVTNQGNSANLAPSLNASMTRFFLTRTLADATTASIQPRLVVTFATTGLSIDITLRIGLPQLEQGAFATSPILTSGTAATRAADSAVISGANFSQFYNQSEGTVYAEFSHTRPASFPAVANINNGTVSDRINLIAAGNGAFRGAVNAGGLNQVDVTNGTYMLGAVGKMAIGVKANDFAFSANGAAPTTDTSGIMPTVDRLQIGIQSGGLEIICGHIRAIRYYPRRLSDAELQALTV